MNAADAVKIQIRNYGRLMIEDENGNEVPNPDSLEEKIGYAEASLADSEPGGRYQFFRHGYYVEDTVLSTPEQKVFNRIVDLKSGFKPGK